MTLLKGGWGCGLQKKAKYGKFYWFSIRYIRYIFVLLDKTLYIGLVWKWLQTIILESVDVSYTLVYYQTSDLIITTFLIPSIYTRIQFAIKFIYPETYTLHKYGSNFGANNVNLDQILWILMDICTLREGLKKK